MHDIRDIRRDPSAFKVAMASRGVSSDVVEAYLLADADRRAAETRAQELQARRNVNARIFAVAKRAGIPTDALTEEGNLIAAELDEADRSADEARVLAAELADAFPNALRPDVPRGHDEIDNVVLTTHGEPRDMRWARPHWEFATALGLDAAAGADLAGSRFTVLRGGMARLERALGQFMLDLHVDEHGYVEVGVPLVARPEILRGTGQLPKFADDLFAVTDGRYLIPTAEVPLTNLARGRALDPAELPTRLAALTPCFRAEAGAAGRDTRGYLRQHQFAKVELVSVVAPEDADAEHERMTRCAEAVLARLGLVFRRVLLCSGETGFSAARTYDIEVWMPGQRTWREISSCSTCGDFQARRMGARIKGRKELPHTLNGSGVAVGRALVAVLETYQDENGDVRLPEVLHPCMGGVRLLSARQEQQQT